MNSTREEYRKIRAINQSALKKMRQSPKHFLAEYGRTEDKPPTDALAFGVAFHCWVLEKPKFFSRFFEVNMAEKPFPESNMNKKENRAWLNELHEDNPNKAPILSSDLDKIKAMESAMRQDPIVDALLSVPGEYEALRQWIEPETGQSCKGILDKQLFDKHKSIIDLKTCSDASPDKFAKDCANYDYALQAAFYTDGTEAKKYYILAVEKDPPYAHLLYLCDDDFLQFGRDQYKRYLRQAKKCFDAGKFPGYEFFMPSGSLSPTIPAWAERRFN